MAERAIRATIAGLIAFIVALVILLIISVLLPGVSIDAKFWAGIIGLLTALYTFLTGERV